MTYEIDRVVLYSTHAEGYDLVDAVNFDDTPPYRHSDYQAIARSVPQADLMKVTPRGSEEGHLVHVNPLHILATGAQVDRRALTDESLSSVRRYLGSGGAVQTRNGHWMRYDVGRDAVMTVRPPRGRRIAAAR